MSTRVLYNGSCPICSREISAYARYAQGRDLPIAFEDLGQSDLAAWGVSEEDAAKRIHVMQDGVIHSGVPAFALVWAAMPRFRWLAWLVRLPIIRTLAAALYDHVLAPGLYALHRRRQAKRA